MRQTMTNTLQPSGSRLLWNRRPILPGARAAERTHLGILVKYGGGCPNRICLVMDPCGAALAIMEGVTPYARRTNSSRTEYSRELTGPGTLSFLGVLCRLEE